jgi:hypothetical protein
MMNVENKNNLKEYMLKEIDIIQDIIKRMAFNSFMIKGEVQSIPRIMFSITLGWFYGPMAILVIIYALMLLIIKGGC